ncbi:NAD-dependent succinate-semialdehyde dehydrogenase [Cupriavidus sp. 2TAF22]|uniref:NAD-dependent succinate-semialdehyde dehydrogenase n=1 Tax=unclassified Cupriavidus TaxID=2640874 RepID=UPI003F92E82C
MATVTQEIHAGADFGLEIANGDLLRNACYVDGRWVGAQDGATAAVTNPANNAELGTVPWCGVAETRQAIAAADRAFDQWKKQTAAYRSWLLRRWFDLILANKEDLARIITAEQGKPIGESRMEIEYGASFVEWFAEEAKRVYGDVIPAPIQSSRLTVLKQAIGVVAAITPWNFPVSMITRKCAPALAAGCTIVLKPSELTPLSALALARLAEEAGFPAGVVNVITGDAAVIGSELTGSTRVRKISFTGSTRVGKLLASQAGHTIKRVSLELGGNAPLIVFDDADLDVAIRGVMASKYRNTGQTCICANRIFVHDRVYDEFSRRLVEQVTALKVGNGLEEGVTQGPLINPAAKEKVHRHVTDAVGKGARVVLGGKPHGLGGTFYEPTVIVDATPSMALADEETFGPVAPLFRFHTEDEVIAMANATPYGLAAYVFTRDLGRSWRVTEALEVGVVGVNEAAVTNAVAPFGGVKESGVGREGSKYGLDEFVEVKYVCTSI